MKKLNSAAWWSIQKLPSQYFCISIIILRLHLSAHQSLHTCMRLSLSVVRKHAPIGHCALDREWHFGYAQHQHIQALHHNTSKLQWVLKMLCYSSWEYDQKPLLEKNSARIANIFGKTHFEVEIKSPTLSPWKITVLSIAKLSAHAN